MTIRLMDHQARAANLCGSHDRYGFWLGCGTGKTISMLAMLSASKEAARAEKLVGEKANNVRIMDADVFPSPYFKTVVVCPKAIMRNAWERDAQHFDGLNVVVCWANTPAKRKALIAADDADVLVINFELFKKHRRDLWDAGVRRLIVDESSKLKSIDTQITKATIEFADHMKSVYMLSGTPAPNSNTEYWSQMRCIDKEVFGDSFYRFAAQYFSPIQRVVRNKKVTVGWKPKEHQRERFAERLRKKSWSLRKEDAVDLPEQLDVLREFDLSAAERNHYDDIEQMLATEVDGETLSTNANAMVNKLRQLCGGWLYNGDDVMPLGKSKLDTLNDLLDEIGNEKAVIWIDYREDASRVMGLLRERGDAGFVMDGSTKDTDVKPAIDRFQDGDLGRLVCHPASVGHGITLTAASYAIFYSPIWSSELYIQARDRIHRKGQTNKCTYYHLTARETVEQSVLWACRNKKTQAEAVMAMLSGKGD